jgi:hypothetical protein
MQQGKQGDWRKLPFFSLLLCHSFTSLLSISWPFTRYTHNAESLTADERNICVFPQNKLLHEQIAVLGRSFLDLVIESVVWIPVSFEDWLSGIVMMRELKQFYAKSYSNLWMGSAAFLCSSSTSHACCCNQREFTLPTGAEKLS